MTPIDVAATEDHDTMRIDYEPREELNERANDAKTHDGERTPEPISTSTPKSKDYYSSHSNSVCFYSDTSSMETTCSPTGRNIDHVYANMPRGSTTALWDEDVHLKEMLVTQLDLPKQQAVKNKK